MRKRVAARVLPTGIAILVALFGAPGPFTPGAANAVGAIIVVDTTVDAEFPMGGGCSLRAAILAANVGGFAGNCSAGTTDRDSIRFNLGSGTPTINLGSDLPAIGDDSGVTIAGNTGGAARIRLHGPGGGTGLTVNGPTSTIRNLVVDGFATGVAVIANSVSITSSILGPNAENGIVIYGSSTVVGGTNGVTPGGPCTGDCNVISGNSGAGIGLFGGSATIRGNFIGTNGAGTVAVPNGAGIGGSGGGPWLVGGTVAGAGNLVSGNTAFGINHTICGACTIQGNKIGTNAAGVAAIPNGIGIRLDYADDAVIGGTAQGAGNVIAGNTGRGIELSRNRRATIQGNWIGTTASLGALGNGGDGIGLVLVDCCDAGVTGSLIGSATAVSAANTIAHNGAAGVRVVGHDVFASSSTNEISGNSIYGNTDAGIVLEGMANGSIAAPLISSLGPVTGTACANCSVDVYSDNLEEGRVFEGRVVADGAGHWTYTDLFAGPHVTATATDANQNTSEFSAPFAIPATPFTDIAASPFKAEIEWLYANRITTGCAATKYCPTGSVTREQMASFLVRMFKLPATGTDFFTDDETSQHEPDINRLRAAEITLGCSATEYCPLGLVLRDQMASFLARAAGLTVGAGRDYFGDDDGNSHEPNIDRNAAAGITTGCGSFVYCPSASVTREQMAAFLRRVIAPVPSPPYPAP